MPRTPGSVRSRRVPLIALTAAALALVFASLIGAQAPRAERSSTWRDRVIMIDGSDDDWRGLTLPVRKTHVALGFTNDGDWLYVCLLATHEQTRAQIAATGLIVWLDAQTGKKNAFGVRFPSSRAMPVRGEVRPDDRMSWPGVIDVLGPGKNKARTVPFDQAGGIQARAGMHPDIFVWELRVPLRESDDHPYAIGIEPGQVVRATIETPEYRGPYPRSGEIHGGSVGVVIGSGGPAVGGAVGGIPVGALPAIQPPLSVRTTVLLAAR